MHYKLPSTLIAAAGLVATPAHAATVTPIDDAGQLVDSLLGEGVTLVGTPSFTGPTGASGTFTDGLAAGLGFDSGVILSTGFAADAAGPNTAPDTGDGAGGPGSDALSGVTFDAATLSFDFTAAGSNLTVNYIFASEEFTGFASETTGDVFALFLDGVNVALLPGGEDVSVNTLSADANAGLLVDNGGTLDPNTGELVAGSAPNNIAFDGFTTTLSATASGLTDGVHTLTLVIADASDGFVDSAVFVQAGSVQAPDVVPTPGAAVAGLLMLGGLAARRRR